MRAPLLRLPALLAFSALAAGASASLPELSPVPVAEPLPRPELQPVSPTPVAVPTTPLLVPNPPGAAVAGLAGVSATLTTPRVASGRVKLSVTLRSTRAMPLTLTVRRDNDQNCALAPLVRVLRVGTREVVYPAPGTSPSLCAQDVVTKTAPARGSVSFGRDLNLAPGEYMIEGWLSALEGRVPVRVSALPVRVTVK